ncbi:MAG: sulfite exporter TauE/SafE family protein [Bacteroidia bacterium]|nr:sulfite exporter TauE/SafE family protein [Bacteroidia bacterium]
MSITLILILVISGLFVGFINTLSAGGTVISIALFLALGMPANAANATNRVQVLIQSFSASLLFKQKKLIENRRIIQLAIPTMIGAIVGSVFASLIEQNLFPYFMGTILLIMIVFMFYKPKLLFEDNPQKADKPLTFLNYLVFFAIGIYGGFIQVGTGYFLILASSMMLGYDLIKTSALKVSVMFLYTIVAICIFMLDSKIYWTYGLLHSLGGVVGSWIATKFALKKGANFVRWVIIVVIILTALNLFGIIDPKPFFNQLLSAK